MSGSETSTTQSFTVSVSIPSIADVTARFPQYGARVASEERWLFDLVMTPEAFIKSWVATEALELPAVAGIAKDCAAEAQRLGLALTPYVKQVIGALVCVLMEKNGYQKAELKRAIPHPAFTKGEVYKRPDSDSQAA